MTVIDQLAQLFVPKMVPQPLPVVDTIAMVAIEGRQWVMLKFDTPSGSAVVFYPPDVAKELANRIRATASGLALVTNPQPGKDGSQWANKEQP